MRHVAGLIYGNDPHYIDHLAPLCSLLEIPLIVTDEEIKESLDIFYPKLAVIYIDTLSATSYVAEHYDILFYCGARAFFDDIFFFQQKLMNKKIHTIWCPHGNSKIRISLGISPVGSWRIAF